ncbi:hypothetical protein COLO4_07259 [Corchorus olitorius]|uniref:Uncharacterized protein n=1 Tax=Corchorus olitorius TaxID=93759 RepID=A0A1R3KKD9_9ROSI|nr:hypothetical protein COLO4_07259 [Corchorus olitorius]
MGETRDNDDADEEEEEKASDSVTAIVDGKAAKKCTGPTRHENATWIVI